MHINEVLEVVINQADCLCLDDSTDRDVLLSALQSALMDSCNGSFDVNREYIHEAIQYQEWMKES